MNVQCNPSGSDLNLAELIGIGVRYHLLSPEFDKGEPYPRNRECVWRVSAPSGSHIRINFAAFGTEAGKDTLTIGSGLDDRVANTSVASYSGDLAMLAQGSRHTKDRVFGDTIWLRFISDATFIQTEPGFWLRLDFISDPRTSAVLAFSKMLQRVVFGWS